MTATQPTPARTRSFSARLATLAFALAVLWPAISLGDAAAPAGPIPVQVVFWLLDARDFDLEQGSYAVDATLELRWKDPRLKPDERTLFEVMNAMELRADPYGYEAEDGWHTMTWRLHGRLRADFDLRRYPFDEHELPVHIEHPLLQVEDFDLRPETDWEPPAGLQLARDRLGPDFHTNDWTLRGVSTRRSVASYGLGERYARYTFAVRVARDPLRFFLGDLAPIMLMVLLGLGASLIPADKIDAKLLLTVLALLVAVELQVAAAERLPPVGYLTLVDWTYAFAYLALGISIVQAIFEHRAHSAGDPAKASTYRRRGAAASALLFFVPVTAHVLWRALG
ncbi:MAG: hypothetical protein H6747_01395 [Deltaproteobacteria bacterium]|nr:hypothetical protein [Deltaproteobacteria bacterium]